MSCNVSHSLELYTVDYIYIYYRVSAICRFFYGSQNILKVLSHAPSDHRFILGFLKFPARTFYGDPAGVFLGNFCRPASLEDFRHFWDGRRRGRGGVVAPIYISIHNAEPESPINEKPRFDGKNMVSCRFSRKPIQGIWLDAFNFFHAFSACGVAIVARHLYTAKNSTFCTSSSSPWCDTATLQVH